MRLARLALFAALVLAACACWAADEDPYLWLEEIDGEKALEWVKTKSDADTAELEQVPVFQPIHEELQKIFKMPHIKSVSLDAPLLTDAVNRALLPSEVHSRARFNKDVKAMLRERLDAKPR